MLSAEYDLRYIAAAVNQLEDYLLSDVLFWPIGVQPPVGYSSYPKLTLGGLLLAYTRADSMNKNTKENHEFKRLESAIDQIRSEWTVNWGKKAIREFQARLTLWKNFLEEYRKEPENQYDRYAYEVGRRVQLELLSSESNSIPTSAFDLLNGLDLILKTAFKHGNFIWDSEIISGFPVDRYWYLYGYLPSNPD